MKKILMICLALVMGLGMCAAAGKPAQKKEVTTLWPDFRLRITDFALPRPELPHFTLPHFALSEEDKWLVAMCVCIALVFLALLLADLVIRRRIASSRN